MSESSISLKCDTSVFSRSRLLVNHPQKAFVLRQYVGLAMIPCYRTPGPLPGVGLEVKILVHLENVVILL